MSGWRSAWIAACLAVLAASCGGPTAPAASVAGAVDVAPDSVVQPPSDAAADQGVVDVPEMPKDIELSDVAPGGDIPGAADGAADAVETVDFIDGGADTPTPDALVDCPGAPGCPCTENSGCDTGWCIDSAAGQVCGQLCTSDCPAGFACAQLGGAGDPQYVCVSKWGWRCDPCVASSQCAAPGQPDARCVTYGKNGGFCGSACAGAAKDCGSGYACQDVTTVEGAVQAQCVPAGGVCVCSPRAVKLQLSTLCSSLDGAGCIGKRTCTAAGLGACDAPTASTEVCDGGDNDCDGATDEGTCDDANPCTSDACAASGCSHTPNDGASCNDGQACTTQDACAGGVCAGGPSVCGCEQDSDCTKQEDGDACNGTLRCEVSVWPFQCVVDAATVVVCDSGADTACQKSVCAPATGTCSLQAVSGTVACNDGDPCTTSDSCLGGLCSGGASVCGCEADADCTGKSDGNLCKGVWKCSKAAFPFVCAIDPASVVTCSGQSDSPCLHNTCDSATGLCAMAAAPSTTSCEDGNACTAGDVCQQGACLGLPAACTDTSNCTIDSCDAGSGCVHAVASDACDDANICTTDSCGTTGCVHSAAEGLVCSDGNTCTSGDSCQAGSCVSGTTLCGCQSDGDCAAQEDGNLCNGTLLCDKSKFPYSCAVDPKTLVTCSTSADTTCAKNVCAAASGVCGLQAVGGNVLCEDGNPCTSGDSCQAGSCVSGTNLCGCQSDGDCAAQEDGNLCNGTLLCDKSKFPYSCAVDPKTLVTCSTSADTTCAKNVCAAASGVCGLQAVGDGTPCVDGNACTVLDVCAAGTCTGQTDSCVDNNPCTDDVCNPASGCSNPANAAACDDGNACTLVDTCGGGNCHGGSGPSCYDGVVNGHETGTDCGGQIGACGFAACPSCGTGQGCVLAADCSSGVCTSGHCVAPSCSDSVTNGAETGVDCGGPCLACPVVLIVAGGAASVVATLPDGGAWSSSPLGVPTVDGVSIAPYADKEGSVGAVAVLRYTKYSDLLDNTVQYAVWNGSSWGQAKVLGTGITTQGWPSVAFTGSAAQLVFHGWDFHYYFASFDGSTWSGVEGVGNPSSYGPSAPVIAATTGASAAVWMNGANGNRVTTRSRTAGGWAGEVDVGPAVDYSISPAVVAPLSGAELLVTIVGSDGQVWWQRRSGSTWNGQAKVANAWTKNRTALANTVGGQVILAYRGMDAKVYTSLWSPGSGAWSDPKQVGSPGADCQGSPAVARGTKGADAELAWVAADGTVWHARLSAGTWSSPQSVATGATSVAVTALP